MKKKLPAFPQRVKQIAKAVFLISMFFILTAFTILMFHLLLPGSISTTVFLLAVATIPSTFVVSIATAFMKSWFIKVFHDTFTLTSEVVGGNLYLDEVARNDTAKVYENYDTWKALQGETDLNNKHFELLKKSIQNGHLELFEFFLEKMEEEIDFKDTDGNTALHYAVIYNRNDMVKGLLKAGADRNIQNHENQTACDILDKKCASIELKQSHLYKLFTKKFPRELSQPRGFSLKKDKQEEHDSSKKSRLSLF